MAAERAMDQEQHRPTSASTAQTSALSLGAVALGWGAVDLGLYGASEEPRLALALLPGTAIAVLLALGAGALLRRPLFLGVAIALAALATWQARRLGFVTRAELWAPRAAFLILGLGAAARTLTHVAPRLGTLLPGLLLGTAVGTTMAFRTSVPATEGYILATLLAVVAIYRWVRKSAHPRELAVVAVMFFAHILMRAEVTTELRRADLSPPPATAQQDAPNLLLVVLDTTRADRLSAYGHDRETMPGLARFVEAKATVWEEARSTSSWTLPSHASLFTGLYPDEHGATRPRGTADDAGLELQAWPARRLRPDAVTLAELLRERGYRTGALLGNISFLRHEFGLDRGFERYDDRISVWWPNHVALAQAGGFNARVGFLPYREATVIGGLATDWLGERKEEPFFLCLNFMDAHAPYIPPALTRELFDDAQPRRPREPEDELGFLLYDRELAYLDSELTRVFELLEADGRMDDTVVIVTSDHGEAFGEHGFWRHGWNLYEESIRVPLLVKSRGPGSPGRDPRPISGADVFYLALHELGLGPEPPLRPEIGSCYLTPFLADTLGKRVGHEVPRAMLAWLDGRTKIHASRSGTVEAFDMAADPGEMAPLDLGPGGAEAAQKRAQTWWADHPPPPTEPMESLDSENLERLQGLGYFGDAAEDPVEGDG